MKDFPFGLSSLPDQRIQLHGFPLPSELEPAQQEQLEVIWKRSRGSHKPFTQICERWVANGQQVFAEEMPSGSTVSQILEAGVIDSEVALLIGLKVHCALNRAERLGISVSSLHPNDIFVESEAASNKRYLDTGDFTVWLRTLIAKACQREPDHAARKIHQILGSIPENGFVELMGRIISVDKLQDPTVIEFLSEAAYCEGPAGQTRRRLLDRLENYFREDACGFTSDKIVPMPLDPKVRAGLIAMAATISH